MGVRGIVVFVDEVFEGLSFVSHNSGYDGGGNLGDGGIVVVQESVFKGHDIVAYEMALGNNEKSRFRGCPAGPEKEQVTLEPGYPSDEVGGDRPVFSEDSACDVRDDDEKVGGVDGVSKHIAEEDDFRGVDGAIIGGGEGNDARALLFLPEFEGGRVKVGANGLAGVALDVREATFRPRDQLVLRRRDEVLGGLLGRRCRGYRDCGNRDGVWASEVRVPYLMVDGCVVGWVGLTWSVELSSGGRSVQRGGSRSGLRLVDRSARARGARGWGCGGGAALSIRQRSGVHLQTFRRGVLLVSNVTRPFLALSAVSIRKELEGIWLTYHQ